MKYKDEELLTTGDIAKLLRVAQRTVTLWCNAGILKCWRLPAIPGQSKRRSRRIRLVDLQEFMHDQGILAPNGSSGNHLAPNIIVVEPKDAMTGWGFLRSLKIFPQVVTEFEALDKIAVTGAKVCLVNFACADPRNLAKSIRENFPQLGIIALVNEDTTPTWELIDLFDDFLHKPLDTKSAYTVCADMIRRSNIPNGVDNGKEMQDKRQDPSL